MLYLLCRSSCYGAGPLRSAWRLQAVRRSPGEGMAGAGGGRPAEVDRAWSRTDRGHRTLVAGGHGRRITLKLCYLLLVLFVLLSIPHYLPFKLCCWLGTKHHIGDEDVFCNSTE